MNPLSTWLRDSGLAQYLPLLEQHSIDLRSLPLLTDADLAELGVPLGHRRLLLKAVAELGRAAPPAESLSAAQGDRTPRDAGRRQLTVLFCDLVGSTALAQRLDPEVLRDLMRGYQQACGAVIERYAGHVAQYLGDGLVVYFGWPQAHEDDAERAVRAALEIIAAVHRVAGPESLQVRIGIATGAVVVGETSAGDASVPSAAVGETPNLAARLQGLAGPDQIVIASGTHRLLGDNFEVEDLGDHSLKGIDGPVRARRIRGVARTESRFDATHAGRYSPFVGREQEVALLLARWEQAREGEGQVVLLVGEPGIGKSRITQVLRERLAATPHTRLGYQCSPYHSGSAFYPIVEQLERAAGFERDDSPERKFDKLEAVLVLSADERPSVTPLFAALLSLPIDRYPPRMLSPQKRKELTVAALVDQPIRLAGQQPVLMICEDAHWIDPSTLETLALAVERFRQAAILLLITCRPEFVPPWTGHGNVTLLNLNRLSRRNGAQMMQRLTGGKPLPAEVLAQILDRTDGVPLFVEELTKHMLEAGLLRDTGKRYELSGPLPALAIPSSLQDSLMARLDRLAPVKEVAQIGACIGREFSHELLAAAALLPEEDLNTALDKLVASELVFRQGSGPEATYSFKHALVQDAAYESLLKSRRQQIHERIARALEKDFPDAVKARPEVLALHLTRAGLIDAALVQWIAAAWLGHANHRFREALGHVDAGLAIVERASAGQRADREVELLNAGAGCHFALTGYASEPAAALLARAEALLDQASDPLVLGAATSGVAGRAYVAGDLPKATAMAERCLALAEETRDVAQRAAAYTTAALPLCQQCEFERARRLLEFAVENYDPAQRTYFRNFDVKVTACIWLALIHLSIGCADQARRHLRLAVDHAAAIAHPFSLSLALSRGSMRLADAGDYEEALDMSRRCIELCDAQSLPYWRGWALVGEGAALLGLGQPERAEVRLAEAAAQLATTGTRIDLGYLRSWRAIALAQLGRYDEARREADGGRDQCLQSGQQLALPRLAYARGVVELLDHGADEGAAEQWFGTALAEAHARGLRMDELRAATTLARLWQQQGKPQAARELLVPIYGWFTEGFDCADLKDAKALLDQLDTGR